MPQWSIVQSFAKFGSKLRNIMEGGRNPPWTERSQKSLDWIGLALKLTIRKQAYNSVLLQGVSCCYCYCLVSNEYFVLREEFYC